MQRLEPPPPWAFFAEQGPARRLVAGCLHGTSEMRRCALCPDSCPTTARPACRGLLQQHEAALASTDGTLAVRAEQVGRQIEDVLKEGQ